MIHAMAADSEEEISQCSAARRALWANGWMDGWMNGCVGGCVGCIKYMSSESAGGWVGEWVNNRVSEWWVLASVGDWADEWAVLQVGSTCMIA